MSPLHPSPLRPPPPILVDRFLQLPRWLLWLSTVGVLTATLGVVLLGYWLIEPAPPRQLVMATGPEGSDAQALGLRYQTALKKYGVNLRLIATAGSPENLARLGAANGEVEVAFFQGGTAYSVNAPGLVSLGSLYYEAIWVFYRGAPASDLPGLAGKRIGIGPEDSGSRALALQLLAVNGVVLPPTELLPVGGPDGARQLREGRIDALFLVAPGESALVQELLADKTLQLLPFDRAEAYVRRFPFLTRLTLPKGVMDFAGNVPAQDVPLVAPTASLLARTTLHPALANLLVRAAHDIHGEASLFNQAGVFPNMTNADFPYNEEVRRYYTSGSSFLQRHLPFWLANLIERMWILVLPALAVTIPLLRSIPPLLSWWRRSRVYRWYGRLKEIELQLEHTQDRATLEDMITRLDEIEQAVSLLAIPLAYSENVYSFRGNIAFVRARVMRRLEGN